MTIVSIGELEIDIDAPVQALHADHELLRRIIAMLKHEHRLNAERHKELKMIAQQVIDDALKGLNDAAANIIAHLPPSTTASTPDTAVSGLISGVQTVTAQLNAAAGPASPPPATP